MTEEERQKKRDYLKLYRIANKEKIASYVEKWKYNLPQERTEKRKKWQKEYYLKNKESIIAKIKERRANMTEEDRLKYNEKKRQRYKIWYYLMEPERKKKLIDNSKRWIDNNKEIHRERVKKNYQQNKTKKHEFDKVPTAQPG